MKHIKLFEEYQSIDKLNSVSDVTLKGDIQLFHYTGKDLGDNVILSPEESIKNRLSWSMSEYRRSDVPRVFYYLDLEKTERDIATMSKFLYTGFVDGLDILKVNDAISEYQKNPEELLNINPNAFSAVKEFLDKGGINYDLLLESIKKLFKGAYYKFADGTEVVIMFYPLKTFKIEYVKKW